MVSIISIRSSAIEYSKCFIFILVAREFRQHAVIFASTLDGKDNVNKFRTIEKGLH